MGPIRTGISDWRGCVVADQITKAERTELKSVVRQQMKVLRAEVEQRAAELMADVDDQIADKFESDDKRWADAAHLAHEAVMEANRKVNDAYRELLGDQHVERMYVGAQLPQKPARERAVLRQAGKSRIEEQVKGALLRLQRQEADLLRSLAIGALETDDARGFLDSIPSVSELVPAARLAELEASLSEVDDDGLPPFPPGGRPHG